MPDIDGISSEQARYKARILRHVEGRDPMELLAAAPARLDSLVRGLSDEELSRRPAPGKWCVREIAAHLADDELVGAYRLRLVLAAPGTPVQAFDPDAWARTGSYGGRDVAGSVALFRALREANLLLLRSLDPAGWDAWGLHAERGAETVRDMARYYAGHDVNHFRQVEAILRPGVGSGGGTPE